MFNGMATTTINDDDRFMGCTNISWWSYVFFFFFLFVRICFLLIMYEILILHFVISSTFFLS